MQDYLAPEAVSFLQYLTRQAYSKSLDCYRKVVEIYKTLTLCYAMPFVTIGKSALPLQVNYY